MIIGYAGGGTRNIIANKPVRNMAELKGLTMRVMGAPIQTQMFQRDRRGAFGDRLQRGLQRDPDRRDPGRGERGRRHGAMKFYEVGPDISLTQHAITVRPICFSGKTFRRLPPDLQAAILKAGKEAGKYGREIESSGDDRRCSTSWRRKAS